MLGPEIHNRITAREFRPYTMVLANGDQIGIGHQDSVTLNSVGVRGRRFFASSVNVLQTLENQVVERVISLPMIAQIVEAFPFGNGASTHGAH